ncbi:MAG TPA: hypothetical protein VFR02_06115, partial [bacterium]|nr:hypothetical protein [bacterium]
EDNKARRIATITACNDGSNSSWRARLGNGKPGEETYRNKDQTPKKIGQLMQNQHAGRKIQAFCFGSLFHGYAVQNENAADQCGDMLSI